MRYFLLTAAFLLASVGNVFAQATVRPCVTTGTNTCPPVSAANPLPVSGSISLTFPTIGDAVPSTGVYMGVNVGGDLTGFAPGTAGTASTQVLSVQGIASMTPLLATGTGTAGTAATGVVTVQGIASMTPLLANPGTAANWGVGATAASVPANAILSGCAAQSAEATAVTTGQMGGVACDLTKKQIVLPYANPENFVYGSTSAMTGTTSTSVIAAAGGSLRNYITACTFSNSHATVGTMILLQDGSGGSTLWQAPAAAVFGGAHVVFPTPLKTTANTALFTANVTTGANTFVSCTGYKGL